MGLSGPVTHPAGNEPSIFAVFGVVILIHEVHERLIDVFQLLVVLDRLEHLLAVFLDRAQDADLQIFAVLVGIGGDQRQIAMPLVFQLRQDLKLVFLAVLVGDGDIVRTVFFAPEGFLR